MISRSRPGAVAGLASLVLCLLTIALASAPRAFAADPAVPWECSTYSGEAQTRCINVLLEDQRNRIGQLEGQLQSQQAQLNALQDQLTQQSQAVTPPATSPPPPPAPYAYIYPPYGYPYGYASRPGIGLGFSFGGPYHYGPRYWGRRFYGHWGHGHHR